MQKYLEIDHARAQQSNDKISVEYMLNIALKVLLFICIIVAAVCAVKVTFLSDDAAPPVVQNEHVLKKYGF